MHVHGMRGRTSAHQGVYHACYHAQLCMHFCLYMIDPTCTCTVQCLLEKNVCMHLAASQPLLVNPGICAVHELFTVIFKIVLNSKIPA